MGTRGAPFGTPQRERDSPAPQKPAPDAAGQAFRSRTLWQSKWNVSAGSRSAFAMMISANASLHALASSRWASACSVASGCLPRTAADLRVRDWRPTDRLGDVEHRQVALLVTLSRLPQSSSLKGTGRQRRPSRPALMGIGSSKSLREFSLSSSWVSLRMISIVVSIELELACRSKSAVAKCRLTGCFEAGQLTSRQAKFDRSRRGDRVRRRMAAERRLGAAELLNQMALAAGASI